MRWSLLGWAMAALLAAGCGTGTKGADGGHITFPLDNPDAGVAVGAADPAPAKPARSLRLRCWLRDHEQLLVGKP